jgi:hypothetical protein
MMVKLMADSASGIITDGLDGTLRCPACGAAGYPNDRYCACCGSRMTRVCKSCGAHILQPVAYYCTQCGVALGGKEGNPASTA